MSLTVDNSGTRWVTLSLVFPKDEVTHSAVSNSVRNQVYLLSQLSTNKTAIGVVQKETDEQKLKLEANVCIVQHVHVSLSPPAVMVA